MRKTLPNETLLKFGLMPHSTSQTFLYGLGAYECKIDGFTFRVHNTNEDPFEDPFYLQKRGLWEIIACYPISLGMLITDEAFDVAFLDGIKFIIEKHKKRK